ncbi:sensor histidine kinase [Burkholderia sp. Ac-20379]|uniref:sensor histidine kinase n=1 Tax=Burkholderia sp. Ac-20379 TaxID=2703900 RepID=UPI00198123BE|nr:HAMP domain-containing sensor histidine kinase [Burkholderia sp. Ac-20379]MBN3723992.1 HAMP domain-containing histidine kinase [Burkholderia sp. Ac-20379]
MTDSSERRTAREALRRAWSLARPGNWRASGARMILGHAVVLSVSLVLLIAAITISTTSIMERGTDVIVRWELTSLGQASDGVLAVDRAIPEGLAHANYYGVFDRHKHRIAGNIEQLPEPQPAAFSGTTYRGTLLIDGLSEQPILRAMVTTNAQGDTIVVAHNLSHIHRVRNDIIKASVLIGAFCLVLSAAAAAGLNARQNRRIHAIAETAQRIARGELSHRLPVAGRDEIDLLAEVMNQMLREIERLMIDIRNTNEGIAHDLRTPLSHVRILLDRIGRQTRRYDNAELDSLVATTRRDTEALLTRFSAMMRLSQIDSLTRKSGYCQVDVEALMREVHDLFEPLADSEGKRLSCRSDGRAEIRADRTLLFEAVTNLVDNAIKFTPAGGHIALRIASTERGPTISVTDDGPGIAEDEREAIFQRFYRSPRAIGIPGSGIGLAIVVAIARLHDFSLRVEDACPGTRFEIACWPHGQPYGLAVNSADA